MSKRSNSDIRYSEMMEDLQAAFLLITNNPNEILKSKSDLIRALQISGRNPNPRNIDKYWKAYERIGIDEFIEIGKDEHELTENELIAVFRDIDVDNNGYISHREMIEALTLTGDGMNKREANELIQTADVNRDNKIDYKEFARLILGTIRDAKQEAKRKTKKIPINKNHRYSSREDVRRSPAFNRRDNRDNRDDLDNRDFLMETLDRSPRRKNSERRHHHQRTGSRLSFKDEKEEFSDDFGIDLKRRPSSPHRRKSSPKPYHRKESNRNDELARSTDSLRSLMRATSLSNLDVRRMSHVSHTSHTSGHRVKRDDSKEKLNDKENKAKKFHSSGKLYEFKLEAANKASTRSAQEPKNLKKWPLKTTKGGIYINEQTKSLFSNSFVLDLKTSANVHFSIQTSTTQLHSNPDLVNMDICLLVVKNEKNLSLTAITENKNNNKWVGTEKLEAGTYFLFPFTSGCHLKRRAFEVSSNEKLFKSDLNGKKTLTTKFKNALNTVFDMFDLDSNGRLSRNEFNFYSIISSTEEVGDEDWDMLKRLVELNKGELTREGFLRLYEIEAENEDFNVDDVYDRLFNLGFNKALEIDQSCPFAINVSCDTDNFDLLLGEIFDLKSCNRYFGHIIQQKGNKKQIKGFDKAEFHEYHNYFWSIIQVDNTSNRETIDLKINASKSENCISNLSGMEEIATIKPGKSKIVMFLAPNNPNKDWTIRYDAHF